MAGSVLRRKTAVARPVVDQRLTAARALRASLLRTAQDIPGLHLEAEPVEERRVSLSELMELIESPALFAVLSGPAEALGMAAISPGFVAALVEARMTGRISTGEAPGRRMTRTDAMLAARFLDAALDDLAEALASEPDITWAGGFRYASYLEDLRPIGLMLEEGAYRLLTTRISVNGRPATSLSLALPAAGRGVQPRPRSDEAATESRNETWSDGLQKTVSQVQVRLDAVIARVDLPLAVIASLTPGMILPLGKAGVDRIEVAGLDGRPVGSGKLGQAQGFRALRIIAPPSDRIETRT